MTFSSQVKNELTKIEYDKNCCKKCLLYGLALFGKSFSSSSVSLQTENENTAMLYKRLLKELCNIDSNIVKSPSGRNFTVTVSSKGDAAKLMMYFMHDSSETSLKVNVSNFVCPQCQNAFFAGAFLACGTVSSPQKDYHLEFCIAYRNLSKSFVTVLQEAELSPKVTTRKGYNIVYFKESEAIEDCLYLMGASAAMFDMMNIKIIKDIRNKANRKANCETANIERTVNAAVGQIEAIEKIKKAKKFDSLSPALKEMAKIRCENPDASLGELAGMFEPPLSRSGVNHRLNKLVSLADSIK